ncbi:hypothetical protein I4U23_005573 [Adineta vaga]|nr:hypothetical protein I4U23_005573 [Adineta vaga]
MILTQPHPFNNNNNIINGRIEKKHLTQPLRRSSRLKLKQTTSPSQNQLHSIDQIHYKPNSALGKHLYRTGHSINFEQIQILNQDQIHYRLLIKESIAIRSKTPQLNGTDTSVPLYVFPEGTKKKQHNS